MTVIFFIGRPPCSDASVTWISDAKQKCTLVQSISHLFAPLRWTYFQACWAYLSLALSWNLLLIHSFSTDLANPGIDRRALSFFWHSYWVRALEPSPVHYPCKGVAWLVNPWSIIHICQHLISLTIDLWLDFCTVRSINTSCVISCGKF